MAEALFSPQHEAALELDLSLWRLTLQRHEAGHGRTRYHRHMTMALQCWDRFAIDQLPASWTHFMGTVWKEWIERQELRKADIRKKRKREATFWEIRPKRESSPSANNDVTLDLHRQGVEDILSDLIKRTTTGWSEFESRLSHAVHSIVPEISRGFFLPLLTVALGAMARVRALFWRWRVDLVSNRLPEMISQLSSVNNDPLIDSLSTFCRNIREEHQENSQKSTGPDKQTKMLVECYTRLGISSQSARAVNPKKTCTEQAGKTNVAANLVRQHSDPLAVQCPSSAGDEQGGGIANEDMGERMTSPDVAEVDHNRQVVASIQNKGKSKKKRKTEKPKKQKRKDKKVKREADFFDNLFDRR